MTAWRKGGRSWGTAFGLVTVTIAAFCLAASPAGARVVFDKVTHHWFGIVPPPPHPALVAGASPMTRTRASATPTCDSTHVDQYCATPLVSHGGPVQHAENDYLFFWDPNGFSAEPGYVTDMQNWLSSVAAGDYSPDNSASNVGSPISVIQQYYDMSGPGGTKNFLPYAVRNAGTIMDKDAFPSQTPNAPCTDSYTDYYTSGMPTVTLPTCVTAAQLFAELNKYLTAHPQYPRGINTEYFILTPPGLGSCDDSSNTSCAIAQYCGWHSFSGSSSNLTTQTVYANLPWTSGTDCDVNRALTGTGFNSPNIYTSGIDSVVGTFSHELSESMTDPNLNGWWGHNLADEVGDKCGYQYLVGTQFYQLTGLPTTVSGAYYNTTLNSNNYLLQMEYDNRAAGCNQWDTDTQPTATIAHPAHPVSGTPASFSLTNVTTSNNVGIAYVNWSFGDGTTGRSTGAAAIAHTFTVGGTRTVTAIVTDNDGNEVKETALVTVTQGPATIVVKLSKQHPAPKGTYTVKLTGFARPGGTYGASHNRSELDLFEQAAATCQTTRKAEQAKVASGKVARVGQWFALAGAFTESQVRQAVSGHHNTVHFCGYVSRSANLTDARAATFYTTT
jgi:hypothetical protein